MTKFTISATRLKQFGWASAFLAILAAMLFPAIIISSQAGRTLSIFEQAALIAGATIIVQLLRKMPAEEVTGRLDRRWITQLGVGAALGAALMLFPALFLAAGGWVTFSAGALGVAELGHAVLVMAGVAVAEELLFRGVLFQRLLAAFGVWPAQLLLAALFLLTHMGNPGMEGATRIWAGFNIFIASLVFGAAYLRTGSLALPIGLHFMANTMQGVVLGFGISGESQGSFLVPTFTTTQDWVTGGSFGLEASLPGLVALLALASQIRKFGGWNLRCSSPRISGNVLVNPDCGRGGGQ